MEFKKSTLFVTLFIIVFMVVGAILLIFLLNDENGQNTNKLKSLQQNAAGYVADYAASTETTSADSDAYSSTATTAAQKGGYDAGYQAGYSAGVKDGNVQLSSVQAAEQAAYDRGYADGIAAANSDAPEGADPSALETIRITVSGSFTAIVRAVLPDYQTDDETLQAAVVQFGHGELFVMKVAPEVCKLLTADETYTFLVDEQTITVPGKEFLLEDNRLSAEILKQQYIAVGSVRAPRKEESGSDDTRLTYKFAETDNKGEIT